MLTNFESYDVLSLLTTYNSSQFQDSTYVNPTYILNDYSNLYNGTGTVAGNSSTTINLTNFTDQFGNIYSFYKTSYIYFKSVNTSIKISSNISNFFLNNQGVIVGANSTISNNSSKDILVNGTITLQNFNPEDASYILQIVGTNTLQPTPSPTATPAPTPTPTPAYALLWNTGSYLKWNSGPQDILKWGP